MRKFGKDKFWNCQNIFEEEVREFGIDKVWMCPRIFLIMKILSCNKFNGEDLGWIDDDVEVEESFASGK